METYGITNKPIIDPALSNENEGNNVTKKIDGKIVMRPSSLDIGCWYKYAQNAILGKKSKPSGASQLGTSYHYAIELAYSEKLLTHQTPDMSVIKDIAVVNWDMAVDKLDLSFNSKGDSKEKARDDIANAVNTYAKVIPQVIPIATEQRFTVGLPKPSSVYSALSGSIDLLADNRLSTIKVVDHKLTSAKKTSNAYRMQTGTYELMGKALGYNITATELHNAVRSKELKTKITPVTQHIINPTRDKATFNIIQARMYELINKAEVYTMLVTEKSIEPNVAVSLLYPTTSHEQHYLCSEDWCGFYYECPINNPSMFSNFSLLDMVKSDGMS